MLFLSYALWAFSVPLAMSILVILILRLALYKLPDRDMAVSGWLALGPIGTGALGLLLLGERRRASLPTRFRTWATPLSASASSAPRSCGATACWWILLALLKTAHYARGGMPFNLGWWGFTFPLGVYALATLALAHTTHVGFFLVAGALLVACLALLWLTVAVRTLHGAWYGYLFHAPCLRAENWADNAVEPA